LTTRRFWQISVIIFIASLLRYSTSFNPYGDFTRGPEPRLLALNLYEHHGFSNPFFALKTGPSAHLSPVFPVFAASLMKVFGDQTAGIAALQVAAILAVSLQVALFPIFSKILSMGAWNGVLAASFWILAKPKLVFGWEVQYVALILAALCCLYRTQLDAAPSESSARLWISGLLAGVLILSSPPLVLVFVSWLIWEMWRRRTAFLKVSFVPLVLLPVLILTPWTVRNYRVFQHLIFVRDDLGLELATSNNDCAQFGIARNIQNGCYNQSHPNIALDQAQRVRQLGEFQYNQARLHEALQWITQHPKQFLVLTLERFFVFWMPSETGNIHYASGRRLERVPIYLLTMLSVLGLITLYRTDFKSWAICASCLAFFPLIYYIVQFEYRYRYPILWITFLLGALPITKLLWPLVGDRLRTEGPPGDRQS
jgi:hypothetical protein